jgi:hydrogenase/urease accessory protein HupE
MLYRTLVLLIVVFSLYSPVKLFAHEVGITDTQIKIAYSKVQVIYTAPKDDLMQVYVAPEESILLGWLLQNDGQDCLIESLLEKNLEQINSTQYIMLFDCQQKLGNLFISDSNLYQEIKGHTNYIRVILAGRMLNLRFNDENQSHQIPVAKMLDTWKTVLDNSSLQVINLADAGFAKLALPNTEEALTRESITEQGRHFFPVGFEHIVLGYDHLLFLFGLLLLPLTIKQVFCLITAFSLAHSLTLALSVLDIIRLPVWLVESAIAASIVYIAIENIIELKKYKTQTSYQAPWKRRLSLSFLFGLIHGLGFSFILREIGFGESLFPSLVFFNLGVEVGQLAVIALVYPLIMGIFSLSKKYTFSKICSFLMAMLGTYWLLVRATQ